METGDESDSEIQRDVEDELKWDPDIKADDIAVRVKDGVVTLTGFVRATPRNSKRRTSPSAFSAKGSCERPRGQASERYGTRGSGNRARSGGGAQAGASLHLQKVKV